MVPALSALLLVAAPALWCTGFVFGRVPAQSGTLFGSAFVSPNGTDADAFVYDSFTVAKEAAITQVRWRGGYAAGGTYGHVTDFWITIYASTAGDTQPLVVNPHLPEVYLAHYDVGGDADEMPAGTFGSIAMYDYVYELPTPFIAEGNTKYWIRIEALQATYPDWGIAAAGSDDGSHYRFLCGTMTFATVPGTTSYSLLQ